MDCLWVPFDHYYHWTPRHIRKALQQVGFEEARPEHILGIAPIQNLIWCFGVAYVGYDCLAQLIHWFTWPLGLTTGFTGFRQEGQLVKKAVRGNRQKWMGSGVRESISGAV